ncbi:MAG: glycosyltransferase family 2 protein [Gemmiger sp.]|uniref:glycosyltransferase family 2 protein n=1 Tax=Gemmiger sp. TaxID=2049027 RepID=UPI002E78A18F|nr:glycosyltransferase family 2 protein [Gemmiger sp.]MEE0799896.1 glycosyltransferase family 2 protein [Gemmiger sp.]
MRGENCGNFDRKIIVIIPVYNCKNYLCQAVDSVLLQPYSALQILLIDDGSTDGSAVLCDELSHRSSQITVIHQQNGGVSQARNVGMEYLYTNKNKESDYITFLDADDAWSTNWIDTQLIGLLKQGYDLIGLQSCTCNTSLTRRSDCIPMQEGEYRGGERAVWLHAGHMGAMLYRIGLVKKFKIYFYKIKASEDKIFSMQCLYLADKIYLTNRLMYLYRQNAKSAMHTREKGIPYYMPIIDAYIRSDKEMLQWKNPVRGSLHEGNLLAKIYIMDMIEEEWSKKSGVKNIEKLMNRRQDYCEILEKSTNSKLVDERWLKMQRHKCKYILKNKVYRILSAVARKILYFRQIRAYVDRKRYPISI